MCKSNRSGFTLIELMIVVSIIGIIAAIAIPNLTVSKRLSNERTAAVTMRSIHKAQLMFSEAVHRDVDANEVGEYATDFQELTGDNTGGNLVPSAVGRSMINNMIPSQLVASQAEKNGYRFQILTSADAGGEDPASDELQWAATAWPQRFKKSGITCWAINELGTIYSFDNSAGTYEGVGGIGVADLYGTPFDNKTIGDGAAAFQIYNK